MVSSMENSKKCDFETAINLTGFGKYNICMVIASCLLIQAMYMDMFGVSVMVPAIACDMKLTTAQQGLLSAVPLIGVIISSYGWGLAADIIGRRRTLLIAMPIGFVLGAAASIAPTYTSLAVLKFFSVMFSTAANAASFVLTAESVPRKNRNRFMFILTSFTTSTMFFVSLLSIPLLDLPIRYKIPWLNVDYRPWRMMLQIITLPAPVGLLLLLFLNESPKFLLSKKREKEALEILQTIFQSNMGRKKNEFPVSYVYLDERQVVTNGDTSVLKKMWNQTAPLFKPPLLRNSAILYYLLLCAYMTSTGFTMWVPTMTNAFFTGDDSSGQTFCQVASRSANHNSTNAEDCDRVIQPMTLYALMVYSGVASTFTVLQSFVITSVGKKRSTLIVFVISTLCGVLLFFVKSPLPSIGLFYLFLYVTQILGNINSYLVDLNPTHLRGMAACLSIVVSRGFGFFSVQLIGSLMEHHCTPMLCGYVLLVVSGLVVALFLPPDSKLKIVDKEINNSEITDSPFNENDNKI